MMSDLKFALRSLLRTPAFTIICLLTLAVGIGANTAIFSVVNGVLIKDLGMKDPASVFLVQEQWHGMIGGFSGGNFAAIRESSRSFDSLAASTHTNFTLITKQSPERVLSEKVTHDYFRLFGIAPILGRVLAPDEDRPGGPRSVVISERLWQTAWDRDAAVIGRTVRLNDVTYTVVGVMPKSFDPYMSKTQLWVAQALTPTQLTNFDEHGFLVVGRLKQGLSEQDANTDLQVLASRLRQLAPAENRERGYQVAPLKQVLLGDHPRVLRMMLAAAGLVLLIACANIANLQLARARSRGQEISVRAALGASPRRIVRQLLTESLLLGIISVALGVLLAYWSVSWIVAHGPQDIPRLGEVRVEGLALIYAFAVAVFSSVIFGLAPALRAISTKLTESLDGRSVAGMSRDRMRNALVIAEFALALVLMVGAGLLIRSLQQVSKVAPGFDPTNMIVGTVGLSDEYRDPNATRQAFENIITAAAAIPGVRSAAVASATPFSGAGTTNGLIPEGKAIDPSNAVIGRLQIVSTDYRATARVPLKAGRDFTTQDTRETTRVALVNETLARALFPAQNPIGKRFACCEAGPGGNSDPVWREIVGVYQDVRSYGLNQQAPAEFYLPLAQAPPRAWDWLGRTMNLVLRVHGESIPSHTLQAAVASAAPGTPLYGVSTMQQQIANTLERSHFNTFMLTIFASTALLLSSIGIYGVLSYTVAQRTREIGIRMALGGTAPHVMRSVMGHGLGMATIGITAGLACALGASRLLASMLYEVATTDTLTFVVVPLILVAVAFFASYMPARRATKVDPLAALRAP